MAKLRLPPDAPPPAVAPATAGRRWAFVVRNDFVSFSGEVLAESAEAAADQIRGWLTAGIQVDPVGVEVRRAG